MAAGAVAVPTVVPLRAPHVGQHKTSVDTETRIELHSDTEGAAVYYTINGAKPEPFKTIGLAAKSTLLYQEPFVLPPGRRTIKAVAVTRDGRESFVVTKVFDIENLESEVTASANDDLDFIREIPVAEQAKREVQKFVDKMVTGKEAWADVQRMKENAAHPLEYGMDSGRAQYRDKPLTGGGSILYSVPQQRLANGAALYSSQAVDGSRCCRCFAPRPMDPSQKYCSECGCVLSPTAIVSDSATMGSCWNCKSVVPVNMPKCLACDVLLTTDRTALQPKQQVDTGCLLCAMCGTPNSRNNRAGSCDTCSASLNTAKMVYRDSAAAACVQITRKCTSCSHVVAAEARFCDRCGCQSLVEVSGPGVVCGTCGAMNNPNTQYCFTCGIELHCNPMNRSMHPSTRPRPVSAGRTVNGRRCVTDVNGLPKWSTGVNVSTQTVGLYYPSQRDRQQQLTDRDQHSNAHKPPVLSPVSPGRGYWRKQMEHICGHLKAHTADSVNFRALVAEPRLGKIISAEVEEDGDEFVLTVSFKLHEPPRRRRHSDDDSSVATSDIGYRSRGQSRDLLHSYGIGRRPNSSHNDRRRRSLESEDGGVAQSGRKSQTKKTTKKKAAKKTSSESQAKITPEDRRLLKEIGRNGEGRPVEIRHLIEEGASAECVNKEGLPALHVAVLSGHADAVQVLLDAGADVNARGPNGGNTALHEAVLLGPSLARVIDALLTCGAGVYLKNDRGDTAYDLAVKNGQDTIIEKFASHVGQSSLDKLTKPRPARTVREV